MSKEIISPKLLGLVLDEEVEVFKFVELPCKHNTQSYITMHKDELYDISLDTLTRLCKEWLIKEKDEDVYLIEVNYREVDDILVKVESFCKESSLDQISKFQADTELEAVIKATEWVAKEKGLI